MNLDSATLNLPDDHPSLAGHFPSHPVVPGVVALTELVAVLEARHGLSRLRQIVKLKFHRLLVPGMYLNVFSTRMGTHRLMVHCKHGGELVISAVLECEFKSDESS